MKSCNFPLKTCSTAALHSPQAFAVLRDCWVFYANNSRHIQLKIQRLNQLFAPVLTSRKNNLEKVS